MKRTGSILLAVLVWLGTLSSCALPSSQTGRGHFCVGFAEVELAVDVEEEGLYVAGYDIGKTPVGVLDLQQLHALWLEDGSGRSALLISVDCVGLSSASVEQIRRRLKAFKQESGCGEIHVISTHTHAGVDTLGLWGPLGVDGKQDAFMQRLYQAAQTAAYAAYADRCEGTLEYAKTLTDTALLRDSRDPQVVDPWLYQLRFTPSDPQNNGIRLVVYGAHAEALRGDNRLISGDYPAVMADCLRQQTGEELFFLPGAIGGLVMTQKLVTEPVFDAVANVKETGRVLAQAALSETKWRQLEPVFSSATESFWVQVDNTVFRTYLFLGILQNATRRTLGGDYLMQTAVTALRLGDVTLALLPGEIFPELVFGTGREGDPAGLKPLAAQYGVKDLVPVGLADDEIGYVIPPSDYVLDEKTPYFSEAEDPYEETNSVGRGCAEALAKAWERALGKLK